jgi:hypothetical protein
METARLNGNQPHQIATQTCKPIENNYPRRMATTSHNMRTLIVFILSGMSAFAADITGTVVLPNGQPAAGAQVALTVSGYQLELVNAKLEGDSRELVIADQDGQFSLPLIQYANGIVAVSENGYAELGIQEFVNGSKIVLQPWGRIEGVLHIGTRIGTNEEVRLGVFGGEHSIFHNSSVYSAVTDDDGKFGFTYVPPGVRGISHKGIREKFVVKPGETNHIIVGGSGRAVIGKLSVPFEVGPEGTTDTSRPFAGIILEYPAPDYGTIGGQISPDGTFRVDDVSAGTWGFEARVNRDRVGGGVDLVCAAGKTIVIPEMPGGRSDEPFDMGTVKPEMIHVPQIGEAVTPFEVKTTDGGTFKLADQRGKYVLLDFEPLFGYRENESIEAALKSFGTNILAVLTMEVEPAGGYEIAGDYKECPWPQTHLRDMPWYLQTPLRISLGLPADSSKFDFDFQGCMLLGPDGKIVAKNLLLNDIKVAVANALGQK